MGGSVGGGGSVLVFSNSVRLSDLLLDLIIKQDFFFLINYSYF